LQYRFETGSRFEALEHQLGPDPAGRVPITVSHWVFWQALMDLSQNIVIAGYLPDASIS